MRRITVLLFLLAPFACDRADRETPAVTRLLPGDARHILDRAEHLDVFSLNPDPEAQAPGSQRFHGYVILSSRTVKNPGLRARIVSDLYAGIAKSPERAACFIPRHGVRAVRSNESLDLVICFECSQLRAYPLGAAQTSAATASTAEAILNQVLAAPALTSTAPSTK